MSNKPLVSVITPTYNAERFISSSIESVVNQTMTDWEMIIVDDCSTDRTVKTIESYQKKYSNVKLIKLDRNYGPAYARNQAIEVASGRYLAFLDSDDEWYPEKLKKQLEFMESNKIAFSFTKYEVINESGISTGIIENVPDMVTYHQLLKNNVIGCLTVMLDMKQVGKVKMENIRSRQDYALWLDLCKKGYIAYGFKEVLSRYRVVKNSVSSNKFYVGKQNWKLYRQVEKLSLFKSIWYFSHYLLYKIKKYSMYNKKKRLF